jgi:hypothetical protein
MDHSGTGSNMRIQTADFGRLTPERTILSTALSLQRPSFWMFFPIVRTAKGLVNILSASPKSYFTP